MTTETRYSLELVDSSLAVPGHQQLRCSEHGILGDWPEEADWDPATADAVQAAIYEHHTAQHSAKPTPDARDEAYDALERLFRPALPMGALSEEPELIRETARKLNEWADAVEQRTQRNLAWALQHFRKRYSDND